VSTQQKTFLMLDEDPQKKFPSTLVRVQYVTACISSRCHVAKHGFCSKLPSTLSLAERLNCDHNYDFHAWYKQTGAQYPAEKLTCFDAFWQNLDFLTCTPVCHPLLWSTYTLMMYTHSDKVHTLLRWQHLIPTSLGNGPIVTIASFLVLRKVVDGQLEAQRFRQITHSHGHWPKQKMQHCCQAGRYGHY